jgi:hypothetical protein
MTTNRNVTAENLNHIMEFGHVIRVNVDGSVSDSPLDPYISLYCNLTSEDHWEDEFSIPEGWQLMKGYSGQYGYAGPVMHASEFIGGGMARDILATPGDYVALSVESFCDYAEEHCIEDSGCNCEPAGWSVAFKPAVLVQDVYHYGNERTVTTLTLEDLTARLQREAEHATDEPTRAGRRANVAAALAELESAGRSDSWGWHTFAIVEAGE